MNVNKTKQESVEILTRQSTVMEQLTEILEHLNTQNRPYSVDVNIQFDVNPTTQESVFQSVFGLTNFFSSGKNKEQNKDTKIKFVIRKPHGSCQLAASKAAMEEGEAVRRVEAARKLQAVRRTELHRVLDALKMEQIRKLEATRQLKATRKFEAARKLDAIRRIGREAECTRMVEAIRKLKERKTQAEAEEDILDLLFVDSSDSSDSEKADSSDSDDSSFSESHGIRAYPITVYNPFCEWPCDEPKEEASYLDYMRRLNQFYAQFHDNNTLPTCPFHPKMDDSDEAGISGMNSSESKKSNQEENQKVETFQQIEADVSCTSDSSTSENKEACVVNTCQESEGDAPATTNVAPSDVQSTDVQTSDDLSTTADEPATSEE